VILSEYLRTKGRIVEAVLKEISGSLGEAPPELHMAMDYSLFAPGKRIRPVLAIAACEALQGQVRTVLPFACALEMIHTYSLIHDDLPAIDNDDVRRGRATCHKVFGDAGAILAGDGLLTEAFRVMADPAFVGHLDPATAQRLLFEVAGGAGTTGMVGGQWMDVIFDGKKGSKQVLAYIHRHKTAAMIRASVRVGAIAAGATGRRLQDLTRYGESIGLAFQVMDDLLDATGEEETVGKRLHKDVTKQTYVKHYGIEASRSKVEELTDRALRAIAFLEERGEILRALAMFLGQRAS
jgi:geranylgeranyl diphosphate synthase, type II